MAVSASGSVSLSTVRTEWGRSGAIKMSEMYRGGSHVRSLAANNNATNLASSVPTSGSITLDNFRGTTAGFKYTFSAGATNQNASTLFGSDYSVNYRKEIVIDSGVELGATSTSEEALEIDSGGLGTITITNNGTLSGAGGAAGAAGGDAFEAAVTCTFINNGTVRAGGGGGGNGGNGGNGSYSSSSTTGQTWTSQRFWRIDSYLGGSARFDGYNFGVSQYQTSKSAGNAVYYRGNYRQSMDGSQYYNIYRTLNNTYSTNGGAGGAGALGAGYNQSAGSGSGGSGGGTNAGSGGAGGNGGGFGSAGTTGSTGTNGNSSNGSAGSAGGASGKYLRGLSFVTFTNNGTAQGDTA
jgi:hypothetical protein